MQRLKVYQSLWAMEGRIPGQPERSLEHNIALIHRAGFDGISAHDTDPAQVEALNRALEGSGMGIEGQCFPATTADLDLPLRLALGFPLTQLDLQPDVRPRRVADCLPLLDGWTAAAEAAGVPLYIETHRDRMTTDLHFTLDLLEARPALPLLADLSHFLVGREFAMPVSDAHHAMMRRIKDNAWSFTAASPRASRCRSRSALPGTGPGWRCFWTGGPSASKAGAGARLPTRRWSLPANSARRPMRSSARTGASPANC